METLIILLLIAIFIAVLAGSFFAYKTYTAHTNQQQGLLPEIGRIEAAVKNEITANRAEANAAARSAREELWTVLQSFEAKLQALITTTEAKLKIIDDSNTLHAKDNRKEQREALELFKNDFTKSVQEFNQLQKDSFLTLLRRQDDQNSNTTTRLDQMRDTLEKKLSELQHGNEKKLDEMRATVDEKLQKTLEARLGESFRLVSERLEAVHKGLGDMQQLATGVGDLKKVLSNVKTRGVLGEYQLESLLEQTLTAEQYLKNAKTKAGSNAMVEFAVKLPGNGDTPVLLPVDSKFPKEDFELLMAAYDQADPAMVEECRKAFVKGIRKCATDIYTKYVDPPQTTDFAILFLPFESLYAEVLRTPGLFENLRKESRIIVAGPTTLSAFLSSLQMGFRTLAIEKRSGEVWQLLSAVKTEFGNFGGILDKTQKKLQEASNVIELAGRRSRAIEKKLKDVQELPAEEARNLLEHLPLEPDDTSALPDA
ncbi:DNA recombination protein RmuC [Chitinophagaceae bacterium MMS25-I14]